MIWQPAKWTNQRTNGTCVKWIFFSCTISALKKRHKYQMCMFLSSANVHVHEHSFSKHSTENEPTLFCPMLHHIKLLECHTEIVAKFVFFLSLKLSIWIQVEQNKTKKILEWLHCASCTLISSVVCWFNFYFSVYAITCTEFWCNYKCELNRVEWRRDKCAYTKCV